jgi:hypothetical protein
MGFSSGIFTRMEDPVRGKGLIDRMYFWIFWDVALSVASTSKVVD